MDYLLYGGLGIFGLLVLLVKGRGFVTNLLVKNTLAAALNDNKEAAKSAKVLDNKVDSVNIEAAKVDQKIEDLKTQQVTNTEISEFLELMEKKSDANKD